MPENNPSIAAAGTAPDRNATGGSDLEQKVQGALRTVYDPEIPVSIYELGLIYELKVDESGEVEIKMTLTAANCPEAQSLPARVESVVKAVPGVTGAKVELVWEPPWSMSKMSDAAKLQLGLL